MILFPFYQDIEDREFLVVGGGLVAKEKIEKIRQFTDKIHVVAPETDIDDIPVEKRAFVDSDLDRCDVCIVATANRALNTHIAALCKERGILVNVVDDRELCTFIFPSFVKRGVLTVSITTSGTSPAYARTLRKQIEEIVPDNIDAILERMDAIRASVPGRIHEQKNRSGLYKEILASLLDSDNQISDSEIEERIKEAELNEKNNSGNQRK